MSITLQEWEARLLERQIKKNNKENRHTAVARRQWETEISAGPYPNQQHHEQKVAIKRKLKKRHNPQV
jgi:hypothetical protein